MSAEYSVFTTVLQARRRLAQAFAAAGLDSPELDARVLVSCALDLDHAGLIREAATPLSETDRESVARVMQRRLAREPVARIVGRREFWGMSLQLSAATLVPRPETETVVEAALTVLGDAPAQTPVRVADLGTGSGAILLALLSAVPQAVGVGTDLSPTALQSARANALELGLLQRATFVCCDFAAALRGDFDLIVSNPPYVRRGDLAELDPEVRDHDPALALDGGDDGLACFRRILNGSHEQLAPGGALVLEVGAGQATEVAELARGAGFRVAHIRPDLGGVPRALTLCRV